MSDNDEKVARKASARYWETEESVNSLAEELGISKGRLYDLLRPLPIEEVACPRCGGSPPVHPNRTARDRGQVSCLHCGWEGELADLVPDGSGEGAPHGPPPPAVHRGGSREPAPLSAVAGSALIGLAAGLILGRYLGR